MVNHPNRRKAPAKLSDTALAKLLKRVEGHKVSALALRPSEYAALITRPDLITTADGGRWRHTPAGRQFVRDHSPNTESAPVDANRIYWLIRKLLGATDDEIEEACLVAGLDVSRSRINGWRKHPADRKHVKITLEELEQVLLGLIELEEP